ncbi:MAG: hypothetical protein L6290_09770 [Thermodesulfovibrionales bacterium]|nr:hypothetical protein [Thermodesulfovibrionales bacterium]
MLKIKYNIPNLSNLEKLSPVFMYNRFFTSAGPSDYEAYALTMNFIRLVDLTIQEYENGRNILEKFISSKSNSLATPWMIVVASGHFEICISSLKRVINYLKSLRGHPKVPHSLKDMLPRKLKVLTGNVEKRITNIRDAVEHLENRIQKGDITHGQSLCMIPIEDGLELGRHRLSFTDLAVWLTEAHNCALKLIQYREPKLYSAEVG